MLIVVVYVEPDMNFMGSVSLHALLIRANSITCLTPGIEIFVMHVFQ